MTDQATLLTEQFRDVLHQYDPLLRRATLERAARFQTGKKKATKTDDTVDRLIGLLSDSATVAKIIADLNPDEKQAIDVFRRSPPLFWRWDHAQRLLAACGVSSPSRVLRILLMDGIIVMRRPGSSDSLTRFDVIDGIPPAGLPEVALSVPLRTLSIELPNAFMPLSGTESVARERVSDGWDLPLRLGALWSMAWRLPFKRTQQGHLFKRDADRLTGSPLLSAPMVDAPVEVQEPGLLIHSLALRMGIIDANGDEQGVNQLLTEAWPQDLDHLLLMIGSALLQVEEWSELEPKASLSHYTRELPSSRGYLLLLLNSLPASHVTSIEDLVSRLSSDHSPWNGEGELIGPMRHPEQRLQFCRQWVSSFVLGPLYQCGFVAIVGNGRDPLGFGIRLSPLGRRFVTGSPEVQDTVPIPQTLLVQPNHEMIVFRQGLTPKLLATLVLFTEIKAVGAAIVFEINADSVYRGLEAGLEADTIINLLQHHGGRELPSALAQSIRTWSQKRTRVTVYCDASLLEFTDPRDQVEALARGLEGIALTDRLLLVTGQPEKTFKNLRIAAARDYKLPPEQCVVVGPDGISMTVDLSRSDLMLEAEMQRFAVRRPARDRDNRQVYEVTPASLSGAMADGLTIEQLQEWFRQRTGEEPSPSVNLMLHAARGTRLSIEPLTVVEVQSPIVADGLLQHPATRDFIQRRIGPTTVVISKSSEPSLRESLAAIGIEPVSLNGSDVINTE